MTHSTPEAAVTRKRSAAPKSHVVNVSQTEIAEAYRFILVPTHMPLEPFVSTFPFFRPTSTVDKGSDGGTVNARA